jgi:hypothetical protein
MILWISVVFVVISPFAFLITDVGFFSPHFSQICQVLFNLVYFFQEWAFCFIDYLYGFFGLYFINFGAYFFIIPLFLLVLGFAFLVFLGV